MPLMVSMHFIVRIFLFYLMDGFDEALSAVSDN
jgi:hypothetical protein